MVQFYLWLFYGLAGDKLLSCGVWKAVWYELRRPEPELKCILWRNLLKKDEKLK